MLLKYFFSLLATLIANILLILFYPLYFLGFKKISLLMFSTYFKTVLFIVGVKVKIEGKENIKKGENYLVASNHQSIFDIPVVGSVLPIDIKMFAKKELKFCIKYVAEKFADDFELLGQDTKALIEMTEKEWPSIKYREALELIKEKDGMVVEFGKDLRTIEEQAIMSHFDTPVAVTHYPVVAMGFYKPRDPENPDEALCFDILAPKTGVEITGGSERSMDIEDMKERLRADGEDPENYSWYFDTRRYGGVPHAGYGVGTERVIAWICGLDNIKDAIPFPRTMLRWKP